MFETNIFIQSLIIHIFKLLGKYLKKHKNIERNTRLQILVRFLVGNIISVGKDTMSSSKALF